MPDTALSPEAPTVTATVLSVENLVEPSRVAVTVIFVAPAPSPTEPGEALRVIRFGGTSLSVMVPVASRVPAPLERTALVGEDRRRTMVSAASATVSPLTVTAMVFPVSPAAKFSVPAAMAA